MRKSRFTTEQLVALLKQYEAGAKISELCRQHGISDNTLHRWKRKYGGMEIPDARRLKQLEDENRQLKRIVADQALNLQVEGSAGKKVVTPSQRRIAVTEAREAAQLSQRRACRYTGFALSTHRYRSRRPRDHALRERLKQLAEQRPRWGYRRLYVLLRREGCARNRKLVQRLYREEGLAVRTRRRRKRAAVARSPMTCPRGPNERWSIDFVRDTLADGRVFRGFTVVDDFTRDCPAIEVDHSLPGERVARTLDRLSAECGLPTTIVCDNGPEFQGQVLDFWAHGTASRWRSSSRGSRSRMPSSRASTANSATSV